MESTSLALSPSGRTPEDWYLDAVEAFQHLDVERATGLIQFAIRQDPNRVDYHLFKAKIFESNGSDRRAVIKCYEAALNLEPRNVEILLRLAQHFQAAGMQVRAAVLFQKARELSPNHKLLKRLDAAPTPAKAKAAKAPDSQGLRDLGQQIKALFNKITGREVGVACQVAVHR
ncbi:MAG: hypothetical protein IPQ13_08785 [Holophagaceae bacterium]|nr:hypothetical protein [Holophagaceae bacterium]